MEKRKVVMQMDNMVSMGERYVVLFDEKCMNEKHMYCLCL